MAGQAVGAGASLALASPSGDAGERDGPGAASHSRSLGGGYDPLVRQPPTVQGFTYSPHWAQREAASAVQDAREQAEHWQRIARGFEDERDEAQRRLREAETECLKRVNEVKWAAEQQATEYEDRIKRLEELFQEEREAHAGMVRAHEAMVDSAHADAEARVAAVERRAREKEAAADARVEEALQTARDAGRQRDDLVQLARSREDQRVEEVRKAADARVSECQEQKQTHVEALHQHVMQRQRAMEETLLLNGREKSEAIDEMRRHTAAIDVTMRELRIAHEVDAAHKEAQLDARAAAHKQRANAAAARAHAMLDLEKELHRKTVDRTMGRVVRHLRYGCIDYLERPTSPTAVALQRHTAAQTGAVLAGVGGGLVSQRGLTPRWCGALPPSPVPAEGNPPRP